LPTLKSSEVNALPSQAILQLTWVSGTRRKITANMAAVRASESMS
jgi:hypothetical protein